MVVSAEVGRTGAPAAAVTVVVEVERARQDVEVPQAMVVGQQPPPREAAQDV